MATEEAYVDFETRPIGNRPEEYPPKPVGLALRRRGRSEYLAWGHPSGNNCDEGLAYRKLRDIYRECDHIVFFNGKFDMEVAQEWWDMDLPPWHKFEDVAYLAAQHDPHALRMDLKTLAARHCNMPPDEGEAIVRWAQEHGLLKRGSKRFGEVIWQCPGDVVAPYAIGDVDRTEKLWKFYQGEVLRYMRGSYERYKRVTPYLLESEYRGVRVDRDLLLKETAVYEREMERSEDILRKMLCKPDLNFNSDKQVADALDEIGAVSQWTYTPPSKAHPAGQRSVSKKNLKPEHFSDKRIASLFGYRNRLQTVLGTFLRNWCEQSAADGRIHTSWNVVRGEKNDGGKAGARTGRLSCTPPLMNIPLNWYDKGDDYEHPAFTDLIELPACRKFLLPEKREWWIHRDYNQQELRILAHFVGGEFCEEYNRNPRLDVHDYVNDRITAILQLPERLPRRAVKVLNFGIVYGMGLGKLAESMGVSVEMARAIKKAQQQAIPGLKALTSGINRDAKDGYPIITWGGREFFVEEPRYVGGKWQTYEYKLLNYLIQGSASECTIEALIRYSEHPLRRGQFLVTVHDEINCTAGNRRHEHTVLDECMRSVEFDVPMISDGNSGRNWAEVK